MFSKLLIANRGEIACRIIDTCRRLGIATVAVYADADRHALHVARADQAVRIGPSEAAASYLSADAIIAAARVTGAQAIHPGYGFLSERPILPELCEKEGLIWVGPSADAIRRMGSKIESKRIAAAVGVPGVPGYFGEAQDDEALVAAGRSIGYPLLIKASAGGGGRGMRKVQSAAELLPAVELARKEAAASFGDPSLLLEKLISRPRHLEVQLAGDKHGNLVHLFERECSIQRSYQKVVEEAPAPRLSDRTKALLYERALRLGRQIAYDSLGTVEFILEEGEEEPYFLEMNTRLQVEHPVTEMTTGVDLVEIQIRVANGERLGLAQSEVHRQGWAIEVRLNAEDPASGYRPNTGTISAVRMPHLEGVRVDTGVGPGTTITPFYDSMIAKIIATGETRNLAAARLAHALEELAVLGVGTNQAFLSDLIRAPKFALGELTTRFIDEAYPEGWKRSAAGSMNDVVAAAAIYINRREERDIAPHLGPFSSLGSYRLLHNAGRPGTVRLVVCEGDLTAKIDVEGRAGRYSVVLAGIPHSVELFRRQEEVLVTIDGVKSTYFCFTEGNAVLLSSGGRSSSFNVRTELQSIRGGPQDGTAGSSALVARTPGLVSSIEVSVGQEVTQGQILVVLESMKLMNGLVAPLAGKITEIFCVPGQTVTAGFLLIEIEPI